MTETTIDNDYQPAGERIVGAFCELSPSPQHSHHWVIESPHGETSLGECKYCHGTRKFKNDVIYHDWGNDSGPRSVRDASVDGVKLENLSRLEP